MDGTELIYKVNDKPPLLKLILLGLQHVTLMSVYLVIIVIVVRAANLPVQVESDAVRMGMIALAIATSIQALRPPLGSGYLAAPVVSAIYLKASLLAASAGGLPLVLGMTIFAGLFELFLSRFLYYLRAIFPPAISGFIITIVGIDLGLEGLSQFLGVAKVGVPGFEKHIFVAVLTLSIMIGLSVWWHGIIRLLCSFLGLATGFIVAYLIGVIDPAKIAFMHNTAYFAWPTVNFISYDFSFSLIVPFFVASVAAALRTIGVITTCQKINESDWKRPDYKSIKGGVFADGLGSTMGGLLGIPGMSTGPSLVGVSEASGATSRYIAFAASLILLIFALLPKIASLFLIMPLSVVGPTLMFTGSFMIVGGIQVMTSRNIDTRMTYVIGLAFLFGLSKQIFPSFYQTLPMILRPLTSTSLSLSVIVALVLNLIFRIGIRKEAVITFEEAKDLSTAQLNEFIVQRGKKWRIHPELIERIALSITELMQHLRAANLVHGGINVKISYDQVDFAVKIKYKGDLLLLPFVNQNKHSFLEEESFSYGLADFLTGVYPDKFERYVEKGEAHVNLSFSV